MTTLAFKVYTFTQGYDYEVDTMMMFKSMKNNILLYIFRDSESISDTATTSKRLHELRLMNDIAEIRRAYRLNDISSIGWVRSYQKIAGKFTRYVENDILDDAMQTGNLEFDIEQWIFKEK